MSESSEDKPRPNPLLIPETKPEIPAIQIGGVQVRSKANAQIHESVDARDALSRKAVEHGLIAQHTVPRTNLDRGARFAAWSALVHSTASLMFYRKPPALEERVVYATTRHSHEVDASGQVHAKPIALRDEEGNERKQVQPTFDSPAYYQLDWDVRYTDEWSVSLTLRDMETMVEVGDPREDGTRRKAPRVVRQLEFKCRTGELAERMEEEVAPLLELAYEAAPELDAAVQAFRAEHGGDTHIRALSGGPQDQVPAQPAENVKVPAQTTD